MKRAGSGSAGRGPDPAGVAARRQAAVEQRRLVARGAQHPHQARGHDAAGVVVRDHRRVVADPGAAHAFREHVGIRQRVAAVPRVGRRGQPAVEVDEHGAGQVAGLELRTA